jgi:hypothetical protein
MSIPKRESISGVRQKVIQLRLEYVQAPLPASRAETTTLARQLGG